MNNATRSGHAAYFSHSYRDVPVNTYFSHLFETAGITPRADQKTDVWCTAKLERYMFEMDGFVSIIPRRIAADESITYSPYIGRELMLARRSRGPRVLFVDGQVLSQFRTAFPEWAVPFFHDAPETERTRHIKAIEGFRKTLAASGARPPRRYVEKQATVIAGNEPVLRDAASHVAAILRSENYKPAIKNALRMDEAFDDIEVFESMLDSEPCVFVLGKKMTYSDPLRSDLRQLGQLHPHLHVFAADGASIADGRFAALPPVPGRMLAEGFWRAVLDFLVKNEALADELRDSCSRLTAWCQRWPPESIHRLC